MRSFLTSISLLLLLALLASMYLWPNVTPWLSLTILVFGLGTTIFLTIQRHWQSYRQAECTREKMVRDLALDFLGLLLTLGAGMYVGGAAGGFIGLRAGFWFGLLAGFVGGFLAAGVIRSMWGRLVLSRI